MKSFSNRISAIEKKAFNYVKSFMADKKEFIVLTDEQEDDGDFDNSVGVGFYGKHGFVDYAHLKRVFVKDNELWIEGVTYEAGQLIEMRLCECELGQISLIADCLK